MMSSHLALPRKGHMEQVMQIFRYLKKYHNAELVFDPSDPTINEQDFEKRDWTSSKFGHVEDKEELSPNMPEPRGWDSQLLPNGCRPCLRYCDQKVKDWDTGVLELLIGPLVEQE